MTVVAAKSARYPTIAGSGFPIGIMIDRWRGGACELCTGRMGRPGGTSVQLRRCGAE